MLIVQLWHHLGGHFRPLGNIYQQFNREINVFLISILRLSFSLSLMLCSVLVWKYLGFSYFPTALLYYPKYLEYLESAVKGRRSSDSEYENIFKPQLRRSLDDVG